VEFRIKRAPKTPGEEVVTIADLTLLDREGKEVVKDLSLKVRRSEIFGIAGVEGNGQTELAEAIAGIRRVAKGSIRLKGTETGGKSSSVIRRRGAGLIPEDRRQMGLILEMNLEENVILGKQRDPQFRGPMTSIAWRKVREFTSDLMKKFEITAKGPESPARSLSGGTQQKVG